MSYTYYVWEADPQPNFCTLTYLQNVEDSYEIDKGISRLTDFPKDASFRMNPEFPRAIKLADNLFNGDRFVVVSDRLKACVEARKPPFTEYLPVVIYNHKGRVASSDYCIVNPLQVVDCIDLEASDLDWNEIDPEAVCACFGLVLDEDRLEERLLLFRPKYMSNIVLVREDLVEAIEEADFTGIRFVAVDEFEL